DPGGGSGRGSARHSRAVTLATVVLTASAGAFPGLSEALRTIPVAVDYAPLMSVAPPLDLTPLDDAIGELRRYRGVACPSPPPAQAFTERLGTLGVAPDPGVELWAAGERTARALRGLGEIRQPDERVVGDQGAAVALASALIASPVRGPVLFPGGDL